MQRFCLSASEAGATRTEGISAQYAENSVSEVVDKMKAGAVRDERSPLKEAIDCAGGLVDKVETNAQHERVLLYLEKGTPRALAGTGNS